MKRDRQRTKERSRATILLLVVMMSYLPTISMAWSSSRYKTQRQVLRQSMEDAAEGESLVPSSWQRSRSYEDRRPGRPLPPPEEEVRVPWNDWGIHRYDVDRRKYPVFPSRIEDVVDDAFEVVTAALYSDLRMDPNHVQNAVWGDRLHGRRPVRSSTDVGRIGIEIDGAKNMIGERRYPSDAAALRSFTLQLAARLSSAPWTSYEAGEQEGRPVSILTNSRQEAMFMSRELASLRDGPVKSYSSGTRTSFSLISVHCLVQGDSLAETMEAHSVKRRSRTRGALRQGSIDPARGLVIVLQPTDFNEEYKPPGPTLGAVEALQRVAIRASILEVPTVVISPRFLAHPTMSHSTYLWDQSGYQQSAAYGGWEPPRGPTPWVLRDFIPPIYSWIGCGLPINEQRSGSSRGLYSRVALVQSALEEGHPWHLFGIHQHTSGTSVPDADYLSSTKSSSGRPTQAVLRRVLMEFGAE